jgi:hypothetical protein
LEARYAALVVVDSTGFMGNYRTSADQVISSCLVLLKEATELAAKKLGSFNLPTSTVHVQILEPSGPGTHSGKTLEFPEVDLPLIHHALEKALGDSHSWDIANKAIQDYIEKNSIKPESVFFHDVDNHYLWPLLGGYFEDEGSFYDDPKRGRKHIAHLLKHLDASTIRVFGLMPLEGFSAPKAFSLDKYVRLRPITETDIRMLGRTSYVDPSGRSRFPNPLCREFPFVHSDWWICEIDLPNTRGTADGYNRLHTSMELFTMALRMFKEGSFSLGMAIRGARGKFGRLGVGHNKNMPRYSSGGNLYVLGASEVKAFVSFWKKFCEIMEMGNHYLEIPVRRIQTAGTRKEKADALVDCVIGLEALLSTEDERTEIAYRFRVRGSVLLSKKRNERKKHLQVLKKLYSFRSQVVHGSDFAKENLEENLSLAENALRKVWRWFFAYWHERKSNKEGVAKIDEMLVG